MFNWETYRHLDYWNIEKITKITKCPLLILDIIIKNLILYAIKDIVITLSSMLITAAALAKSGFIFLQCPHPMRGEGIHTKRFVVKM